MAWSLQSTRWAYSYILGHHAAAAGPSEYSSYGPRAPRYHSLPQGYRIALMPQIALPEDGRLTSDLCA